MDSETWQRIQDAYLAALELPELQRDALLDQLAEADPPVAVEVRRLLEASDSGGDSTFLEPPSVWDRPAPATTPLVGTSLGDCTLLQLIGEGGMGSVFEAVQGPTRRRVAVKVLRGFPSAEARQRFDLEARVLAQLQHPCIAQIHTASVHEDPTGGRIPYIVMEFVPSAERLVESCDRRKLDLAERCALLQSVAQAVHHAHLKGIIHRDLKPANVLVDEHGCPKVIDFGIARTDTDSVERSFATASGVVLGTPAYMSPEQLSGRLDDVDARTDVYSLGVMLYELVCGRRPYDLAGCSFPEAMRIILEGPVPRPRKVRPDLPADLETIIQKAIAKDRETRYDSAAALAEDLQRFGGDLPILARPLTVRYQLKMFARRHRAIVAVAALAFVALAAATVIALNQAQRAQRAAESERARANEAERLLDLSRDFSLWVATDLQQEMSDLPGSTPLRRRLLDRVITWLDGIRTTTGDAPTLLQAVARSYGVVSDLESATQRSQNTIPRSLELLEVGIGILNDLQRRGDDSLDLQLDLARLQVQKILLTLDAGDRDAAETLAREVHNGLIPLEQSEPHRPTARRIRSSLQVVSAEFAIRSGRWREAADCMEEAARLQQELVPAGTIDPRTLKILVRRVDLLWQDKEGREAREAWNQIRDDLRAATANVGLVTARLLQATVDRYDGDFLLYADGDAPGAQERYRSGTEHLRLLWELDPQNGDHAHALLLLLSRQYTALKILEHHGQARRVAEEQARLARDIATSAPSSPVTRQNLRMALRNLGECALRDADWAVAKAAIEEAFTLAQQGMAADPTSPTNRSGLAESLMGLGEFHFERSRAQLDAGQDPLPAMRETQKLWRQAAAEFEGILQSQSEDTWGIAASLANLRQRLQLCEQILAAPP